MANMTANGIRIEYETFGDRGNPALLLIMGLGAQMIFWDDAFCGEIASRGFHVIRFDNRDCGLSTHFPEKGIPDVFKAVTASLAGEKVEEAPYSVGDMAADAVALLDGLGIARAHVVGASMGGMIAQTIAINHPTRILSLTSIMSTTGNPEVPPAKSEALAVLLTPTPSDRAQFLDHMVQSFRIIGSPGFELDEEGFRDRVGRAFDRSYDPAGVARQLVAALADGNRKPRLRSVRAPTLVIHGKQDPLVPVEAGADTADAIPGARLVVIEGMGHDLPRGAWPQIVDAITDVATSAGRAVS
ncbi:MAG TPA: alpha/beta fold hydrolase [Candidatus Binatia bacterium]|nr:alpha/beta fold hydrolase [Candidatus Binatia bacterium]